MTTCSTIYTDDNNDDTNDFPPDNSTPAPQAWCANLPSSLSLNTSIPQCVDTIATPADSEITENHRLMSINSEQAKTIAELQQGLAAMNDWREKMEKRIGKNSSNKSSTRAEYRGKNGSVFHRHEARSSNSPPPDPTTTHQNTAH